MIKKDGHIFIEKLIPIHNKFRKKDTNMACTVCSNCGYIIHDDIHFVIEFGIEFYLKQSQYENYVSCNEQIIKNLIE